jgi:hypothetical protein
MIDVVGVTSVEVKMLVVKVTMVWVRPSIVSPAEAEMADVFVRVDAWLGAPSTVTVVVDGLGSTVVDLIRVTVEVFVVPTVNGS